MATMKDESKIRTTPSLPRRCLEIVILAVLYFVTAILGQLLAIPPGNVTPVWIPSGIILVAVLIRGYYIWPGIFLGAFFGNTWAYFSLESYATILASVLAGTGNGIGDVLCAVVGAYLIERTTGTRYPLERSMDIVKFIVYGAILGSGISALFGITSLCMVNIIPWDQYLRSLVTWWTGDGVGVVILTPVLLALMRNERTLGWGREESAFVVFIFLVSGFCLQLFPLSRTFPLPLFILVPLLMWAAFRLDSRLTLASILVVATLAIMATAMGYGLFSEKELNQALIELQLFVSIMATTILVLHGIVIERKQVEKTLQESEERLRHVITNTEAGYFYIDREGRFQQVNGAWLHMHKYDSPAEILGQHFSLTQVDLALEEAQRNVEQILQGGSIPTGEFSRRCKDGTIGYHSFTINPVVQGGEVVGLEGFLIDTTERKRMEKRLIQTERHHVASELSAGMCHNLNNILSGISMPAQMLKRVTKDPESLHDIELIISSSQRAINIVHQLHLSVRGQTGERLYSIDLNESIEQTLQLTQDYWEKSPRARGIDINLHTET